MTDTQLTPAAGYNVNNMVFSKPQDGSIPGSNPPMKYKRINISTKNPDGTIGELILPTDELFSFGVSENVSQETGKVNGHVMPLCLWNKNGPTDSEKQWTDTFDDIVEQVKEHLVEIKDEIEKYNLNMHVLEDFNPLYWKKEKGVRVPGRGPTLYAKLIESKKKGKEGIITQFYDPNGQKLDAMSLLGSYCFVRGAVKIESIFVGKNPSLQIKLYECIVRLMDGGMKSLLRPATSSSLMVSQAGNMGSTPSNRQSRKPEPEDDGNSENDDEGSQLNDNDNDNDNDNEPEQEPEPAPKPAAKKRPALKKRLVAKK
jgi:hypothetical protein